jgi:hypothetical protein
MPLYELTSDSIKPVATISFSEAGVREREGLQRVLREKIDAISPGTLIVAEEFGQWEDSRRRIDLLGVDAEANLVVIELKRTEDGGHMELQAVRYAAMISTLTFDRVVEIFTEHLAKSGSAEDARGQLLDHLGWASSEDAEFAPAVRIVLASVNFSKELTTAVLWLNEQGLDVRCVRLTPYQLKDTLLVDVQQVVPLPEADEYTVQVRAKRQETRQRQEQHRDLSKFILTLGGESREPLNKRRSILEVIRFLVQAGIAPDAIRNALPSRERTGCFVRLEGKLDESQAAVAFHHLPAGNRWTDLTRYFHEQDELLHHSGNTWLLTKMWGANTQQCLEALKRSFPEHRIEFRNTATPQELF